MFNKRVIALLIFMFFSMLGRTDNPGVFRPLEASELLQVENSMGLSLPNRDYQKLEGYEQHVWGARHRSFYVVSHPVLYSESICRYSRWAIEKKDGNYLIKEDQVENFSAYVDRRVLESEDFSCDNYEDKLEYLHIGQGITDQQVVFVLKSLDKLIDQAKEYIYSYRDFLPGRVLLDVQWDKGEEADIDPRGLFEIKVSEHYYYSPLLEDYSVDFYDLRNYPLVATVSYQMVFFDPLKMIYYSLFLSGKNEELRVVQASIGTLDGYPMLKTLGLMPW